MSQRSSRWTVHLAALPVSLLVTGCYATQNRVTLAPLETKRPVSASSAYVDADGRVVSKDQYTLIRPFTFERAVTGERHSETVTALDVEREIDQLLGETHADAATQVTVTAVDYDSGSHTSAANWKWAGWLFEANAAVLFAYGVTADTHDQRVVCYGAGGVVAGIGVLSYLVSFLQDDPSTWRFRVEGQLVEKRAGSN